jgi:hypothetical protein
MKTHSRYILLFTCLTVLFNFSSCKKKWSKPTEVSFKFQLNSNSNSGLIKFSDAYIMLNKTTVTGDRKQSPGHIDLEQTTNFPVSFSSSSPGAPIKFDIPQGTYNSITLKYETNTDQNGTSLQIKGIYTDSSGNPIPVLFIFSAGDNINIPAKNTSGGNDIVLVEGHPVSASIILNPNYWFASVSKSMMDNAELEDVGGVQTILITKDENDDLYGLIINRIKDGNQCVFN